MKFPHGCWVRKNTKVELTNFFFYYLVGVPSIWPYKYEGIDVWGQNCWSLTQARWTPNTSLSNNMKAVPLNAHQNEGCCLGGGGGCNLWATACWKNTRSVCRICQINFNSGRIWAVNTQACVGMISHSGGGGGGGGGMCLENWIVASNLKCGCFTQRGSDGNSPVLGAWILVGHGQAAGNVCRVWCWAEEGFCDTHSACSALLHCGLSSCILSSLRFKILGWDVSLAWSHLCLSPQILWRSAHTTATATASAWRGRVTASQDS